MDKEGRSPERRLFTYCKLLLQSVNKQAPQLNEVPIVLTTNKLLWCWSDQYSFTKGTNCSSITNLCTFIIVPGIAAIIRSLVRKL